MSTDLRGLTLYFIRNNECVFQYTNPVFGRDHEVYHDTYAAEMANRLQANVYASHHLCMTLPGAFGQSWDQILELTDKENERPYFAVDDPLLLYLHK